MSDKYAPQAERWSEDAYADAAAYLAHRAALIVSLGPVLRHGNSVLDLACGDGGIAEHLTACATAASTRARRWSPRRGAADTRWSWAT